MYELSEEDDSLNEFKQDTYTDSYICVCVYVYRHVYTHIAIHMHTHTHLTMNKSQTIHK